MKAEGLVLLTEVLKGSTALKELNLAGDGERKEMKEKEKEERMIGNEIGVEGAKVISEMLKVNTTLTKLNLMG